jgi:hypothetical protein
MPNVVRIPPLQGWDKGVQDIRNALPVRGDGQWLPMARQANWLLNAGSSLVVAGMDNQELSPGSNYSFRYYAWPHAHIVSRLWVISLGGDDDGSSGTIHSLDGTTELHRWSVLPSDSDTAYQTRKVVYAVETVGSSADGQIGFQVRVDSGAAGHAIVQSACCYEVPLVWVEPGDHPGCEYPETNSLRGGEAIYDDESDQRASLVAVQNTIATIANDARRAALWSVWRQVPILRVASTFTPAFGSAVLPVLARRRFTEDGVGNRTIAFAVCVEGTGEFKIDVASGDSVTVVCTAEVATSWITGTVDVSAEDPDELENDGGLRSGDPDLVVIQLKGDDGAGLSLYGFCAGEVD